MIEKNDIKEFNYILGKVENITDESTMDYYVELDNDNSNNLIKALNYKIRVLESKIKDYKKGENKMADTILEQDKEMERLKARLFDYIEAYGELE